MNELRLCVLSLRYSSWSIRPYLALLAAEADFETETRVLADVSVPLQEEGEALVVASKDRLSARRDIGSVTGLFPVLYVNGQPIHESLAICEWVADAFPDAGLWPEDPIERARARSISCEMLSSFPHLRNHLPCHVFARVPNHRRDAATEVDIARVFELWSEALDRSGGPFLFGRFGIADCMYFPVVTRFRTYGVALPVDLERYARRVESHDAVAKWRAVAAEAPRTPIYDDLIVRLGGDPDAALP